MNKPLAFQVMLKPRGPICNLECSYCYYLSKESLYPGSDFRMKEEVLDSFTRQYIAGQKVPEVTFSWQGGEPTMMGLDFFKTAMALQHKYRQPGMRIHNALQTNGTLLNDAWCSFFKEHDFLIGLSLDGPQLLHDAYRLDKGGNGSFKRVMQGLNVLQKHGVDYNILACVNNVTGDHPLDVYRFLRDDVGTEYIQFIPIVEREDPSCGHDSSRVTSRSVSGKKYGEFLIKIFDEWVKRDVGRVFVQIFDVALGVWIGQPGALCIFAETCGTALALEHNGDLYACDHFVDPGYLVGNILTEDLVGLVLSKKQQKFGTDKRDELPSYCRDCEVRFACHGGCPKNRNRRTPDGAPGLNILCEGYKSFYHHIDPYMKTMAGLLRGGRQAAEIMNMDIQVPTGEFLGKKRRGRRGKGR
jgi:uncharacterized protein